MLRTLYRCVLQLHPSGFRKRFSDEMLSIFDHTAGKAAAARLLTDGLMSLLRQWTLRPEFWHELSPAPQPAPLDVPSFSTLDPFRPRAGAVIHGLVLSTIVFGATCFAIKYSWIHVLHVHIPEVQFDSPQSTRANSGPAASASFERPTVSPGSTNKAAGLPPIAPRSSSNVPTQAPAVPLATQNRIAQSAASDGPQSQVKSDAQLAAEIPRQPRRKVAADSARSSNLRSNSVPLEDRSRLPQAQAQLVKPQADMGTTVRTEAGDLTLDAAQRRRVIEGAITNLTRYYVDPDVGQKMADALLAHENSGDDDAVTDGEVFAELLTAQIRAGSHDRYVTVVYSAVTTPKNPPAPTPADVARYRKAMEASNCTFEKVQILPHNIGYLKFNEFPDASICGKTAAAAMASLNAADAIIFDLRDNPGGYSNMVALIATYLFDHPTHLNDFYDRGENSTEQSWTLPPVPGNKLADKPVFVLTSSSTFSAAEAFSYDLKMLQRATLVGETTSGRGHMGMGHRIDDHFTIRVPGMRVTNPISKTNWEGTGVEPDVKVKAADALATAENLAESRLQKK
jgi:hypothetical protein